MMNWLRNFMAGRYGVDQLQWTLLGAYLALSLLIPNGVWRLLALIPLALFWIRFLSRDVYRRSAENRAFLQKAEPVILLFRRWNNRLKDRDHRYYNCPRCKQVLRVPRGRGKIAITCPNCHTTITKKT